MDPKPADPHATLAGGPAAAAGGLAAATEPAPHAAPSRAHAPAGPEPATPVALWPTFLRRTLSDEAVLTTARPEAAERGAARVPGQA
jgi:hypothetical protein